MPKRTRSHSTASTTARGDRRLTTKRDAHAQLGGAFRAAWNTATASDLMTSATMYWYTEGVWNFATGTSYWGLNRVILLNALDDDALAASGEPPAVATFRQIKALGGTVQKGSRAMARVCFYSYDEERERSVPRWTPVFHYRQCGNLPPEVTARICAARKAFFARFLSLPAPYVPPGEAPPPPSAVPSLAELALRVLAAQPGTRPPTLAMCRHTLRAWWPAFGDARGERVLAALADARATGAGWHFDAATRTLTVRAHQLYETPDAYYESAFRAVARGLLACDPRHPRHRPFLQAEMLTFLLLEHAGMRYVPRRSRDTMPAALHKILRRDAAPKTRQRYSDDVLGGLLEAVRREHAAAFAVPGE